MTEKKTANLILSRTRRNQIYLPYTRKKPYFEAIAAGDDVRISELSQENYEYPAFGGELRISYRSVQQVRLIQRGNE